MNRSIFFGIIAFIAFCLTTQGQSVQQTISLGPSYANQVWFGLENSNQSDAPKNNWDLAFELSGFGFGALINPSTGIKAWVHPGTDTTVYANLDTAGMAAGWVQLTNSDTSWGWGALNMCADFADEFDLGWGQYNLITHAIMGKRVFVIKLPSGAFQKFMVSSLINKNLKFRHANLDGSSDMTHIINKDDYTGKGFVYFSLSDHVAIDREPLSTEWDLTFTQYTAYVPTPYAVTGVLINKGREAMKVYPVDDPASYVDFSSHSFSQYMNTLGYDWKTFTGTSYVIADSTVYFVRTPNQDVWKILFTAFEGGSTGNIGFSTEKIFSNSAADPLQGGPGLFLYPNPNSSGNILVGLPDGSLEMHIFDLQGRAVFQADLENENGLFSLSLPGIQPGQYMVKVRTGKAISTSMLIIR